MENHEFRITNCTSYHFDDMIKIEDFDLDQIYDGVIYLTLFRSEIYNATDNRVRFFYKIFYNFLKSTITYILSHYFVKIKIDSYDPLPIEK